LLKHRGRINSNIGISIVQKLDCQFLQLWTCVQPCDRSSNVAIAPVIGPVLRIHCLEVELRGPHIRGDSFPLCLCGSEIIELRP
jgi:hypothetical protein